jgi:hypothetical protein
LKRVHQESLDQTAAEVRRGKPARQRALKTQNQSGCTQRTDENRPFVYTQEAVTWGAIFAPVSKGSKPQCAKSKIFKIFDEHRGMPNN